MRTIANLGVAVTAMLVSNPATAQSPPPDVIIGDWRISNQMLPLCQAITRIDQHLFINITTEKANGNATLFLESDAWSRESSGIFRGHVSWDNWDTSDEFDFLLASGLESGSIGAKMGPTFNAALRTKGRFWLRVPSLNLNREIAPGDLDRAFVELDKCLAR